MNQDTLDNGGEIKINIENESHDSPTNDQNNHGNAPIYVTNENQESIQANSENGNNTKDEIMKTIQNYLHSADHVIDEAGKITSQYGNPIVDYTSKLANKFKEFFNLK